MASQTVYSVRFYAALGLPFGRYTAYTVPDGYVAILRDIDCYTSAGVSNSDAYFEGHLGQTIFRADVVAGTQDSPQWRGRQVFEAGESMFINITSSSDWDIAMSGYLLVV